MKTLKRILFIPLVLLALSGCKNDTQKENDETTPVSQNPVEKSGDSEKQGMAFIKDDGSRPTVLQIAMGSPDHTTLVAAVKAAGLENSLSNAGPLMVFAPTNEAFAALPAGTVENLLKPENKDKLAY
ncbi:MAG: fasciclin domain-containing protein, partial [Gillisia sp.]|nr:fasciclin domain-containing protein [Gillisia sp.]